MSGRSRKGGGNGGFWGSINANGHWLTCLGLLALLIGFLPIAYVSIVSIAITAVLTGIGIAYYTYRLSGGPCDIPLLTLYIGLAILFLGLGIAFASVFLASFTIWILGFVADGLIRAFSDNAIFCKPWGPGILQSFSRVTNQYWTYFSCVCPLVLFSCWLWLPQSSLGKGLDRSLQA